MSKIDWVLVSLFVTEFFLVCMTTFRDFIYLPRREDGFKKALAREFEAGKTHGWNAANRFYQEATAAEQRKKITEEKLNANGSNPN